MTHHTVTPNEILGVFAEATNAVAAVLAKIDNPRAHGSRPGQYGLDLVADAAALEVLHGASLAVFSEESALTSPKDATARFVVVMDPVDGSTNASLGLPWCATSLCLFDEDGPLVARVTNLISGTTYEAIRGAGATKDGHAISPSPTTRLAEAIVGISGFPPAHPGWAQFRALGAAALDLCAVAEGALDGFTVTGGSGLHVWDYAGALLVCSEAGAHMGEKNGDDLFLVDQSPRHPYAAGSEELLHALATVR